jgi:hypothetical protein
MIKDETNKTKKCIWKKCAPKTSLSVQKYKTVVHLSTMREHQQFGNIIKCNIRVIIVWYVWTPYDPVIASRTVVTGLLHMKQQLTAENFIRISSHCSSCYIGNNCQYDVWQLRYEYHTAENTTNQPHET